MVKKVKLLALRISKTSSSFLELSGGAKYLDNAFLFLGQRCPKHFEAFVLTALTSILYFILTVLLHSCSNNNELTQEGNPIRKVDENGTFFNVSLDSFMVAASLYSFILMLN